VENKPLQLKKKSLNIGSGNELAIYLLFSN